MYHQHANSVLKTDELELEGKVNARVKAEHSAMTGSIMSKLARKPVVCERGSARTPGHYKESTAHQHGHTILVHIYSSTTSGVSSPDLRVWKTDINVTLFDT